MFLVSLLSLVGFLKCNMCILCLEDSHRRLSVCIFCVVASVRSADLLPNAYWVRIASVGLHTLTCFLACVIVELVVGTYV